ncbi:glycoside hydrolase N-terminal domain-containing protein, partial [Klebsiella pneumoniae]|uniref:glycoside hydrolase N-terminal domain-containing protein n=1 Tax=Klebsiella pneumoniae TaxID=573 RepID=UPI0025A158EE
LNSFSETYIDFGHPFERVKNYQRWLDLETAVSGVKYEFDGVTYERSYFVSYPDKCIVIKLSASQKGKLSFILRPTVPYKQDFAKAPD